MAGTNPSRVPRWLLTAAILVLVAAMVGVIWAYRATGTVPAVPGEQPAPALAGTRWQATTISGSAVVANDADEVPWLQFDSDDSVSGGDPCNRFRTSYALDGDALRLGDRVVTEMGCGPQGVVEQQGRFWAALDAATRLRRTGDVLELLRSADGPVLAAFTRVPYVAVPSAAGGLPSTSPDEPVSSPAEQVRVRIRNDARFDFDGVEVHFPDGTRVDYGPVAAGASTDYADAGSPAYRYAWIKVLTAPGPPADGRVFTFQPIDYVGEEELAPGQYTYALSTVGDSVDLAFEVDR